MCVCLSKGGGDDGRKKRRKRWKDIKKKNISIPRLSAFISFLAVGKYIFVTWQNVK